MLPPKLLLPLLWAGTLALDPRLWLRLQEQVMVQEGQCALVPCEVSYSKEGYTEQSPAYGFWFRDGGGSRGTQNVPVATNCPGHEVQNETPGRFHLLGDPRNYSCSLDIRDAQRGHGTYYFRVERGPVKYSYRDQQLSVHVTALTHRLDIHLQGPLRSGRPKNITCAAPWACGRGVPPTFSWMGFGLSTTGTDSPVLTLSPGPQHHDSSLTCRVTLPAAGLSFGDLGWLSPRPAQKTSQHCRSPHGTYLGDVSHLARPPPPSLREKPQRTLSSAPRSCAALTVRDAGPQRKQSPLSMRTNCYRI